MTLDDLRRYEEWFKKYIKCHYMPPYLLKVVMKDGEIIKILGLEYAD